MVVRTTAVQAPVQPRRPVLAVCAGNAVEWYDFALYGGFAAFLAAEFFPTTDPLAGLSSVFATYLVAFLVRPAGAIYFGRRGDRFGRRRVMVVVITGMTVATAAAGLVPAYASIGVLAPCLSVLLRAVQGFCAGGEASTAATFMVEHAPESRRGLYGSLSTATLALGLAAGLGTAALLAWLGPSAMEQGWWRAGFLLALPLGLTGFVLRSNQSDTPAFRVVADADLIPRKPLRETVRGSGRQLAIGFAPVAAVSVVFNTFFIFLPTYLAASGDVPLPRALGCALVGLLVTAATAPVAGRLSDRLGRRAVMLPATVGLALLVLPAFVLALAGTTAGLLLADALVGLAVGAVVLPTFLAELFPTRLRATAMSMTVGLATAVFGGAAPLVDLFLVLHLGSAAGPAAYCLVLAIFAVLAVLPTGETAFGPLRHE
jgi:MHS family proline/betaine transporter-like MFS transporter